MKKIKKKYSGITEEIHKLETQLKAEEEAKKAKKGKKHAKIL